ncbi:MULTISPECIES: DeoR/GlpR family DNA-binding transcription regulator [Deinococcus]|uniref:Transcriptional regulator, DeoR family n=2 Tax=Deinococcus geothermalis TaxID=68909 RepID=Q1J3P4_DEIGD|nr:MULTISPECIES: DeoR/GlpR family DNA-binding transcription regulator [Deinococcus]ABF43890.1 transcriptional regulator, DeoR family [Deinococcus geothermalis DSM 11300]TDE84856.1 DeoR/GlpR transcriptional regulator [Deinococcus sp. S9]
MVTDTLKVGSERQHLILRRALAERVVKIKDLAAELGVHEMTVRRDLDQLAEQGLLERVHGGARLLEKTSEEIAHQLRVTTNTEAKAQLARAALALIEDGDVVALDASTTALALARILHARQVTAILTGLDAANVAAQNGVPFLMVGGNFHAPARSFVGAFFMATMAKLHPDKVFFSAKAFSPGTGFTDAHLPEVGAKQALIASGGTRIALLDASKFGGRALATIATLDQVDVLITNRPPSAETRAALDAADIRLIVTAQEET